MYATTADLRIYGEHEDKVIRQLENCVKAEDGAVGVLCADGHYGYSQPVGGAVAYRDHISVSGVGYDIGCGNLAQQTPLRYEEIREDLPRLMDEIVRRISFGMGRANNEPLDSHVLDEIRNADFAPQRQLLDLAAKQLGTVGAGNHYVDLFRDEDDFVWVGVHFGSRGFGHKTASGFLSLANGGRFDERGSDGEMESPPTLLRTDSDLGQSYIAAMQLAGRYAATGRVEVVAKVLEILGTYAINHVHNHHNFAWFEEHGGEDWWVVRKGCTPAFPGQKGFVGATMGGTSVILEGRSEADDDYLNGPDALYSTVHGAGRAMSRTQAAGKTRKRWACCSRDCEWVQPPHTQKPDSCPTCGHAKLTKRWVTETKGRIDYDAVKADLKSRGIELRGGAADEAPGAYKDLRDVLSYHAGSVRVLHQLTPIGVAMAGADIVDPFKD